MEQFAAIRRDFRVEGLSIRELAVKYRVHRRTVRQALASAVPPPRKTPARSSPKLDPFKLAIVSRSPFKGFRHWASTRSVSRPSRQSATGPPGSYRTGLTRASGDELATKNHLHKVTSDLLVARKIDVSNPCRRYSLSPIQRANYY